MRIINSHSVGKKVLNYKFSFSLESKKFNLEEIKRLLLIRKNSFVYATHIHQDFVIQRYAGIVVSKKNNLIQFGQFSTLLRNSKFGFEFRYLATNPFSRTRVF